MSATVRQMAFIGRRSLQQSRRQALLTVPALAFPLVLLAINSSGLTSATRIPGFPTDAYVNFAIVVAFMQCTLFAAVTAGTAIAIDIESGFLNRLQLTPVNRVAILAGLVVRAVAAALIAVLLYLAVGLAAGVTIASGVAGALALIALVVFIAIAFAGIGAAMGARTGSSEAVQGTFPLMFVLFFLSSMNLPRELIAVHWFRTVATWNPVSYLIEAMRSLIISGWDPTALWRGLAVATALLVLSFLAAAHWLSTRMERT